MSFNFNYTVDLAFVKYQMLLQVAKVASRAIHAVTSGLGLVSEKRGDGDSAALRLHLLVVAGAEWGVLCTIKACPRSLF